MSSFRDGFPASKPESQASALGSSKEGDDGVNEKKRKENCSQSEIESKPTKRDATTLTSRVRHNLSHVSPPASNLLVNVLVNLFTIRSNRFRQNGPDFKEEMQLQSFLFLKRNNGKDYGENLTTMTETNFE